MGLFNRKPKADEDDLILIHGDGETSFVIDSGVATWGAKKVVALLGEPKLRRGEATPRIDIVVRIKRFTGVVEFTHHGFPIAVGDLEDLHLVQKATQHRRIDAFKARGYIWRSAEDARFGIRVYLPNDSSHH